MTRLGPSQVAFLDLVRGASALTVLIGHVIGLTDVESTFGRYYAWQSLAVVVFFWLSGFLIAYNVMTRERHDFGDYAIDRFSRIYVLFVPAIAFSYVVGALLDDGHPAISTAIANLLMLHHTPFTRIFAFLPTFPVVGGNSALWTVAIEWWLYMLFGIVACWSAGAAAGRFVMAALAVPAILVVGYFALKEYVVWTWFVGAACAAIFVRGEAFSRTSLVAAFILGAFGLVMRLHVMSIPTPDPVNMYDLQLMGCLAVCLMSGVALASDATLPRWLVLLSARLAFISYALYLFHEPMRRLFFQWLGFVGPAGVRLFHLRDAIIVIVACIAGAAAVALLLENRHLALRARLKAWRAERSAARAVPAEA